MTSRSRTTARTVKKQPKVVVCGIGTGGHYFPAVVTATELLRSGCNVIFLARPGSAEERVARKNGLMVSTIEARPFYGRSLFEKSRAIVTAVRSIARLRGVTREGAGLAFGGFGSVPLLVSCMVNRRDFYVFEPNRVPGRATTMFAPLARRVFLGMPLTRPLKGRTLVTGIPIRQEFKRASGFVRRKAGKRTVNVLFYGGSQGARRLNDLAIEIAGSMPGTWRLTIVCGARDHERLLARKAANTRVIPFTDAPWKEIDDADVIVSRSGALAGCEIIAMGRKAIFIPFPFAIDQHQYHNALYLAAIGDAEVCEEKNVDAVKLRRAIGSMLKKEGKKFPRLITDAEKRIASAIMKDVNNEKK